MGRRVAAGGEGVAGGSGGVGSCCCRDPEVLWPLVERWRREVQGDGRLVLTEGRPTIRWRRIVRLMVLKQRCPVGLPDVGGGGVGLDSSAAVLSDRRSERVPDESTVRKLTRRLGAGGAEMTRALIVEAHPGEAVRPRAVRIDSTVIEADIEHPTDAGLASVGVRALAREGRKLARLVGEKRHGCGIARVRWDGSCGGSRARSADAREKRRPRC